MLNGWGERDRVRQNISGCSSFYTKLFLEKVLCSKLMTVGHRHCQKQNGDINISTFGKCTLGCNYQRCLKDLLTSQTPHTNQKGKICASFEWNKDYKQNTHTRLWARAFFWAELAWMTSQGLNFWDYHCMLLSVCANCQKGIVINNKAQPPVVSNQTHSWHSLAAHFFFRCKITK